jgi:hypothetical protein
MSITDINLVEQVKGTLPVANGGTGATSLTGIMSNGGYASRPTAAVAGRLYFCTDNGNTYQDNGSSWDLVSVAGTGIAGTEPPSTGWTTTTLGTATVAADKGGRLFTGTAGNGTNLCLEYRTLSSNYTATAHIDLTSTGGNFVTSGLVLLNAAGNIIHFGAAYNNGWVFRVSKYTSTTTFSADYTTPALGSYPQGLPAWFRIVDDGTNRAFRFSHDGVTWLTLFTGSRTDFLTATNIGWCCGGPSSGLNAISRMRSWSVV